MAERSDIDYRALIERLGRVNTTTRVDVLLSLIEEARDVIDTLSGKQREDRTTSPKCATP